jgi:hypothetical protein
MRPTREDAYHLLSVLREHARSLKAEAYDPLYKFIMNCSCYLPTRETVADDTAKKRAGRKKVIPPPEE